MAKRVLFVAEAVTLAHVARLHVFANSLPAERYDVLFACDPRYDLLFADATYRRRAIRTVSGERFLHALSRGAPLYDFATLQAYVEEDLAVIDGFNPDVIVGDFRLSLSVSARLRGVPYLAITNAYWNPDAAIAYPIPELPLTRWLGYRLGGAMFRWASPIGFALHARAHNRLQRHYGLAPLGADVRRVYIDGDQVLYADPPGLINLRRQPENHHFIGPIQWSPLIAVPDWWEEVKDRPGPTVYVTLGSSGDADILPQVVRGVSEMAGTVLVATAGRSRKLASGGSVFVADYLPGDQVAKLADLVVCNGGSPTTYQALAEGKPVLGIPSNLDQCLNMAVICAQRLGTVLRSGGITEARVDFAAAQALTACRDTPPCGSRWNVDPDRTRFSRLIDQFSQPRGVAGAS